MAQASLFFGYNRGGGFDMTKYIFLDIDGTLYSPTTNEKPESALRAIHKARQNGHKVFLCTGRSLAEIVTYLEYDIDGYILAAGAKVYADRKCIYDSPIPKDELKYLKDMINDMKLGYGLEGNAGAYGNELGYEFLLKYFSLPNASHEEKVQNAMAHEDDEIYKICIYSEDGHEFDQLEKALHSQYILTRVIEDPIKKFYGAEITNKDINKGTGIEKVLEYYHADRSDAIGIGDSGNDIPMLSYCGTSIAMGNGAESVKAIADYVTKDILDDGIYHAFEHFRLID